MSHLILQLSYSIIKKVRKTKGFCLTAMKEFTIKANDAGQRLDRFVGKAVPLLPESLLQKYIRLKRIKVNGKGAKRDTRLALGDTLQLYINDEFFERPREENSYLKVGTPRLDIVEQPMDEMGRRAAELLIARMSGSDQPARLLRLKARLANT